MREKRERKRDSESESTRGLATHLSRWVPLHPTLHSTHKS